MSHLFRKEAIEYQQEKMWGDVIVAKPLSFTVYTITALVVVAAIFLFLFSGDYSKKQSVKGFLIPDEGVMKVFTNKQGYFSKVYVAERDYVEKDQPLVTIVQNQSLANGQQFHNQMLMELNRQEKVLQKSIKSVHKLAEVERQQLNEAMGTLMTAISIQTDKSKNQQNRVAIARAKVVRFEKLKSRNVISRVQLEDSKDLYYQYLDGLMDFEQAILTQGAQLRQTQNSLVGIDDRKQEKLVSYESQLSSLRQQKSQIHSDQSITLRAARAGRVTGLQVREGESVQSKIPLLSIIPAASSLEAHLYVPTRAIGLVKTGQLVRLQYDAFPYQKYGVYQGEIIGITETIFSPTELDVPVPISEPVYRIIVKLDIQHLEAFGRQLTLQAGMTLNAEIIYDQRSLISWLLEPIYSRSKNV